MYALHNFERSDWFLGIGGFVNVSRHASLYSGKTFSACCFGFGRSLGALGGLEAAAPCCASEKDAKYERMGERVNPGNRPIGSE